MAQRQFRSDDTSKWLPQYGNGSDGDKTVSSDETYDGANAGGGSTASSGQKNVSIDAASTFANGDLVLIHQSRGTGAGAWELNKIASGGGTTSLVMAYDLCNTYTESGASQFQVVEIKQYKNLTINSTKTWSAPAWDGSKGGCLPYAVKVSAAINGTISGNAKGYRGGAGALDDGGRTPSFKGEGTTGDRVSIGGMDGDNSNNGTGGGGGDSISDNGQGGGGGGYATAGENGKVQAGSGNGGTGGDQFGNADLTLAPFGGAGGGGGIDDSTRGGNGGNSGAFILGLMRDFTIDNTTGLITNNGGNGENSPGDSGGGGGGGTGGSTLLKCISGNINTNRMTATGGTHGNAGHLFADGGDGGDGRLGRMHIDYAKSLSGSTSSPSVDTRQDKTLVLQGSGAAILLLL